MAGTPHVFLTTGKYAIKPGNQKINSYFVCGQTHHGLVLDEA
jgi:hypothetical protein